jgi:methionyl-tRNA formyltransferase
MYGAFFNALFALFRLEEKTDLMKKRNGIIFMGTPEFAAHILDRLLTSGQNILAVITAPDKPAGRGQQLSQSAVKQYADKKGLKTLQPVNLKDSEFAEELRSLEADLFVVVAFRMLPEVIWSMPPLGTINLHASLLPNYRGAAPINRAIMNGEKESGVTTFFIEKEIDTGKVIERAAIQIGENETAGELHDRLMELGANVTVSTVNKIFNGEAEGIEQQKLIETELKVAPKIFREDCKINWKNNAQTVHNFIRGLSPYPAAWTILKNVNGDQKSFKLFGSMLSDQKVVNHHELINSSDGILFPCSDTYVLVSEIQPEGKRRMNFKEFLAGNRLQDWSIAH